MSLITRFPGVIGKLGKLARLDFPAVATQAEMEAAVAANRVVTPSNIADYFALETPQATTSGTEFDFTDIRAGVKRITVMLEGVSLSGTDDLLVQIGDSGGFETTGYTSTSTTASAASNSTAGFIIRASSAAVIVSGSMVLTLIDSANHTWVSSHSVKVSTADMATGGGDKSLSAALTQVRLTRTGTDNPDAGSVNILVE